MQQPDIEIYVKGPTNEQIKDWLNEQFDGLEERSASPKRQVYNATWQEASFEIMVLSKVQSGYSSIWFDSPSLPWANDKVCAQAALASLPQDNLSVRCVAASWQEGDAPDQWLHLTTAGEELVNWQA
ncbi:MAG TPA: hypothetical protein DE179_05715 [Oceanospirillaceae bacterium]|nr:hypothetical protein [Oceanospirillaceae bacterium]